MTSFWDCAALFSSSSLNFLIFFGNLISGSLLIEVEVPDSFKCFPKCPRSLSASRVLDPFRTSCFTWKVLLSFLSTDSFFSVLFSVHVSSMRLSCLFLNCPKWGLIACLSENRVLTNELILFLWLFSVYGFSYLFVNSFSNGCKKKLLQDERSEFVSFFN